MRRSLMPALVATEWRPAPRPAPEEDLLQTAFELAYFIHRDRRTAAEISLAAMQKLEVAAVTQLRRLYYKGRGEGSGRPGRFKPSWADRHLLQRLVYFESEKWERLQEQRDPGSLTEEDYLLRFVKHLSQITMKRSSFYASIAIGRILHAYSTADTMAIYDAVAPEGCERKQGDYFRARKAQLLEEVRRRFGDLVTIVRGPHREERIESCPATPERAAWMRECLRVTTPWATTCPDCAETAAPLSSGDLFDRQEVRRFHELFHPPCFSHLSRRIGLTEPRTRLAIPRFRVAARPPSARPPGSGDRSARLLPEERLSITAQLHEDSRRRQGCPTGSLRVLVDGKERARLDPIDSELARFSVEDEAEVIEVRGATASGELLVAVHLLTESGGGDTRGHETFTIVLESGQSIAFRIDTEHGRRMVELTYRETASLRSAHLAGRRLARRVGRAFGTATAWLPQPLEVAVLLGAVALLLLGRPGVEEMPRRSAAVARFSPALSTASPAPPVSAGPAVREASSDSAPSGSPERAARAQTSRSATAGPERRDRTPERLASNLAPPAPLAMKPEPDRAGEALRGPEAAESSISPVDLDALMPLQAARESFLEGLAGNAAASTGQGPQT
ncbi:MAG TPA: hypothetical protein VEO37_05910, partial [Thermoanaerobaculia bacterium]|nr:hypothetical protein [Thermoanaerobaculia bacterium]